MSVILKSKKFVDHSYDNNNAKEYDYIKRNELKAYIESVQHNPMFLNYMEKLKKQNPVLPEVFPFSYE